MKESFRIIFRNVKLNTGGIKGKNLCKRGIYLLTDRLGVINHMLKHEFNVVCKVQFKTGKKRCIRNLGKTAEVSKLFTEF